MDREVSKMKVIYAVFLERSLWFLPASHPSCMAVVNAYSITVSGNVSIQVQLRFSWLSISTHWYNLVTIDAKSEGTILNLFMKTGNPPNILCDLLTPLPLHGRHLVSYRYQSEDRNYWTQIKGHDPQPVLSKQGTITLSQ